MIVAISGLIGSGKDTVADYLVAQHGFVRESFAGALKDAVAAVFDWDRALLEGRSAEARVWREKIDTWWATRLNLPQLTPRWVLQNWGTEVLRRNFHDDIWVASLENRLRKTTEDIVISDCRFPNELKIIKNLNGITVRVARGTDPKWFEVAETVNAGLSRISCAQGKSELARLKIHPSEYSWVGNKFDVVINNNGTIDDLYAQAEKILTSKIGAEVAL